MNRQSQHNLKGGVSECMSFKNPRAVEEYPFNESHMI